LSLELGDIALHYSKSAVNRAEQTWAYEQSSKCLTQTLALKPLAEEYLAAKVPNWNLAQLSPKSHLKSVVLSVQQCALVKDSLAYFSATAEWVEA